VLDLSQATLDSLEVGAVAILNSFFQRLQPREILERHLPPPPPRPGRDPALPPATVLLVLLRNILLARQPLWAVSEWLRAAGIGASDAGAILGDSPWTSRRSGSGRTSNTS
jgi:hypothetical protein